MTIDPAQLTTFRTVVAEGSFEAAARTLHVTPSAVSQRIKALEQTVGQVLVRRAKPCEPTDAGRPLVRLAGQLALLESEALAEARGPLAAGGPRTRLAIVVNADSLATWFMPALAALPGDPAVSFDIVSDDQDHTAELLRAGTVLAAVTAEDTAVQGCRVEPLGAMRYLAVAAPALHADHFAGRAAGTGFATAPMIALNRKDRLQHRFLAGLTRRPLDPPVHYIPGTASFAEAIRLGLGWGLMPEQTARDDIAAGRCVELTGDRRHLDVPLHWQCWRIDSTVLDAVTTAVRTAAAVLRSARSTTAPTTPSPRRSRTPRS